MPRVFPITRIRVNAADQRKYFLIAYADPVLPADAPQEDACITLDAVIGKDGAILELSAQDGDPRLIQAALETVRHWTYRPTLLNGIPIEVATQIEVRFARRDSCGG